MDPKLAARLAAQREKAESFEIATVNESPVRPGQVMGLGARTATEEALFHSTTDVMFKNAMVDCDYQRVANIGTHMKDYRKMLSDIQQARATIKAERKSRLK